MVDARGTPLGVVIGPAHQHDNRMLAPTPDAVPDLRDGRGGRPRCRPDKLHADEGFDDRRCRNERRARGLRPRIARRGIDISRRLGRHRWAPWVVERTYASPNRFRRLRTRYERRADIHLALTTPGCLRQAKRFCWAL